MEFNNLEIKNIIEETEDTKVFIFNVDEHLKDKYSFIPGQYLTLKVDINENEIRRAYSICSASDSGELAVAIKKVKDGAMSNFLHEKVDVGDKVAVSIPEGKFVLEPDHDLVRDHYFITAGSGITPIMSMIRSVIEQEPKSTSYLLYGSRDKEGIIFNNELNELVSKYEDQLHVVHTLSNPKKEKASGFSGIIGLSKMSWQGDVGRITVHKVKEFLEKFPSRSGRSTYYLCGPGNMIEVVESHLLSHDISKGSIMKEYFSTSTDTISVGSQAMVKVILDNQEYNLDVKSDETILEAVLRHKLDAPYSCTSGACSSCMAKKIQGDVKMDACYALEDEEVDEGYILTCQSRILSESAEITYDV